MEKHQKKSRPVHSRPLSLFFLRSIDKLTKLGITHKGFSLDRSNRSIMKKILTLIALFTLLLVSSCVTATFVPTENDRSWMNLVVQDSKVVVSDMGLASFASENMDMDGVKTYSDLLAADLKNELEKSQSYTVSSELQETKSYWEMALESMKTGSEEVSLSIASGNLALISHGSGLIKKGTEYMMLANRALNTMVASTSGS